MTIHNIEAIAIKALYDVRRHMQLVIPVGYKFNGCWQIVNKAIEQIENIQKETKETNETISDNTKN